jgi:glycolate dehydrogenase FAD-binding subunit
VPAPLLDKLRAVVGGSHVLGGVDLSPYVVDGRTPEAAVFPGTVDEVAAVVNLAAEAGMPLVPWGGGTGAAVGVPPPRAGVVLGLSRLRAIVEHEPGDLTVTAQAGVILCELQTALGARGQWLSLDPPDAERATLGGVLAANASGPRRHLYGTARDLLIGVTVVTADGSVVRGGGRVVKNVAGYDLPKLFIGSYGTLGIIVEATLKLRPRPDDERLVAVPFERLKDAGAAVRAILASDLIPNAVDLADAAAARAVGVEPAPAVLLVGFDGLGEQVDWQVAELASIVRPHGGQTPTALPAGAWPALARAAHAAFETPAAVMMLSVLPSLVADTMEQGASSARQRGLSTAWSAHAGVGLVTGAVRAESDRQDPATVATVLAEWRAAARAGGGHASIRWAPLAVKAALPVWDDAGAAGRIMQRIKAELDPHNLLNPGRFVAGM